MKVPLIKMKENAIRVKEKSDKLSREYNPSGD